MPSGSATLLKEPPPTLLHIHISHSLPSPLTMQRLHYLLAFTLFTFVYAIPQSPVGSSGSGDTGGTNSGDAVGSAAAASSASQGR